MKREIYAEFFDFLADFLRGWAAFATFLLGVLKKARFETKGGERLFGFLLRVERVDHSGQQASFPFPRRSTVTALPATQPGIEQISHRVAEHVERVDDFLTDLLLKFDMLTGRAKIT